MGRFNDLSNQTFGELTVIKRVPRPEHLRKDVPYWLCKCSCGNETIIPTERLTNGQNSCGCKSRENAALKLKKQNNFDLDSCEYGIGFDNIDQRFLFDKDDYDLIKDYCWCIHREGKTLINGDMSSRYYVVASSHKKKIRLHRLIMDVLDKPDLMVDHINGDGLDNRKSNLRVCSCEQNNYNRKSNKYKGVLKVNKRWRAIISWHNNHYHLGYFDTPEEAAEAYNKKAIELFGEFAYLNKIEKKEVENNYG